MLNKPIKFKIIKGGELIIETETGHIVKYNLIADMKVDLKQEEDGKPYFSTDVMLDYLNTEKTDKALSIKEVEDKFKMINILPKVEYDHIQIGFVYSDGDPNNHKWMLNFMDVNNNYVFGYYANIVKLNCPFTTVSWEDGVWHGRFVVQKKDISKVIEKEEGNFMLSGKGDIGKHILNPVEKDIDTMSLRFNVQTNVWYCDLMKKGEKIGEMPCKNIICDVPFEGKVDIRHEKPKVTAEIKVKDVKGISMALNALIIKAK